MAAKVLLTGFNKVAQQLHDLSKIHAPKVTLTVGFWAEYATYVHEDLTKHHAKGKAKFLEDVFKTINVGAGIQTRIKAGIPMQDAMETLGITVLHAARRDCPVDTGFLRDSGFYLVETT